MSDPFQTLGVARDATDAQIKTAYRKLAMELHPDKNPGDKAAEERFKEVNAAYEILKDPQKKAEALNPQPHGFGGHHGGPGFNPFAGGAHFEFRTADGRTFRTNMHGGGWQAPQPENSHIGVIAVITLEEALTGKTLDVQVAAPSGMKYVKVNIPAGIDNGNRVRVAGQGDNSIPSAPPGDLFVNIRVAEHPKFVRLGQNLFIRAEIDAFHAMLGTQIEMETLEGKTVQVNVPPGVNTGSRLRITGHGMPTVNAGPQRGDLYIEIEVTIPALNEAQRKLVLEARDAVEPKSE
jgi:DnaJ-class molecular chaperone